MKFHRHRQRGRTARLAVAGGGLGAV